MVTKIASLVEAAYRGEDRQSVADPLVLGVIFRALSFIFEFADAV
jgi:hypothetical protein